MNGSRVVGTGWKNHLGDDEFGWTPGHCGLTTTTYSGQGGVSWLGQTYTTFFMRAFGGFTGSFLDGSWAMVYNEGCTAARLKPTPPPAAAASNPRRRPLLWPLLSCATSRLAAADTAEDLVTAGTIYAKWLTLFSSGHSFERNYLNKHLGDLVGTWEMVLL